MSFQSLAQLKNQTNEQLFPAIVNTLKVNDEFIDMLISDAMVTDRLTIKFNRLQSEGASAYVGCDDAVTVTAVSANAISVDLVTINKSFSVCLPGRDQGSTFVDPTETEMNAAIRSISKTIGTGAIVGNVGSGQLWGLDSQVVTTVAAASAADLLPFLDQAYDECLSRTNLAYVVNPAAARSIERDIRGAAGGITYGELANTDRSVSFYRGIPIVRSASVAAGTGYLVDRDQFKLFFGQGDGAIGSIFNLADAGAMETRLRRLMHMYVNCQTLLFDTQAAVKLTGLFG